MNEVQFTQIAIMHHEKGLSQQDIALKMGLSKMTVSRMLQKAKVLKIVQTSVKSPFILNNKLGDSIMNKYGLQEVYVVGRSDDTQLPPHVTIGRFWAFQMGLNVPDDYILGIGVGNTIGQITRNLIPMKTENLHIIQLMGGLTEVTYNNPLTIVQETCRKLAAKGTYFTSYATVENKEMRDSIIFDTPMGQQVSELWAKCREALFGIGTIEKGTLLSPKLVSDRELNVLKDKGAIGDILGHCFDKEGNFISTELEDRLLSIPVAMLKKIEKRIAVACGEHKVDAILGTLKSGVITVLVTDENTAKLLLQGED